MSSSQKNSSNIEEKTVVIPIMYTIAKFKEVKQNIRLAHLTSKKKEMRKNGLPTLLSGMGVGSVEKVMLEALEDGVGLPTKEACMIILLSINKLMISFGYPEKQIPETAVVPV